MYDRGTMTRRSPIWRLRHLTLVVLITVCVASASEILGQQPSESKSDQIARVVGIPPSQAPGAPLPSFEVVSIKPNPNRNPYTTGGISGDADHVTMRLVTTGYLIMLAYNVKPFQITGAPSWVGSDRYDIDAKRDEATGKKMQAMTNDQRGAENRLMLQSLLADRFGLKVHRTTVKMPVYSLTIAKPDKIPVAEGDCPTVPAPREPGKPPCGGTAGWNGHLTQDHVPISALIGFLENVTGRIVSDNTGLKGSYNVDLDWTPDSARLGPSRPDNPFQPADPNGPSLQEALGEQLGLKLVPTTGPVDTIVVDDIQEPSPN